LLRSDPAHPAIPVVIVDTQHVVVMNVADSIVVLDSGAIIGNREPLKCETTAV